MQRGYSAPVLGAVLIAVLAAGCALSRAGGPNGAGVSLEVLPCSGRYALDAWLREANGSLEVHGHVKQLLRSDPVRPGHVDVAVVGRDGAVLEDFSVRYGPEYVSRKGRHYYAFSVRLPSRPPEGSTVRLACHEARGPDSGALFRCAENLALGAGGV
ncbi:MAG: hypothetical protein AB1640_17070 [bacterium]